MEKSSKILFENMEYTVYGAIHFVNRATQFGKGKNSKKRENND